MSTKAQQIVIQYNQRIMALMDNLPETVRPNKENLAIMAARDLYQNMLELDNTGINYLGWISVMESFFKFPALLEVDPDGKLEDLANKFLAAPDLMAYYRTNVDTGVELDRVQLLTFIKSANRILGLA